MASCLDEWNRRQKLLKERDRKKKQEAASTLHNFNTTAETQQLEFEKKLKDLKIQDRSAKAETKDMLVFTSTGETTQQLEFQKRLKDLKTQDRSAKAETKDMLSMFHGSYHGGDFDNFHSPIPQKRQLLSSSRRTELGNGTTMAKRKSSKIIELTQSLHDSAGCLTYDDPEPADETIKFLPTTPMQSPMNTPKSLKARKKFEDIFPMSPLASPTTNTTPNSSSRRKKMIDGDDVVAADENSTDVTELTEEKINSLPPLPPIQPNPTNAPKSTGERNESDEMGPIPPVQKALNDDIKPPTPIRSPMNTLESTGDLKKTDDVGMHSDDDQLPLNSKGSTTRSSTSTTSTGPTMLQPLSQSPSSGKESEDIADIFGQKEQQEKNDNENSDIFDNEVEDEPGRITITSSNGKIDNSESQQRQNQKQLNRSYDSPPNSPKSSDDGGKKKLIIGSAVKQPRTPTKISPKGRKKLLAGLQKSPMMMSPQSPFYEDIMNDIQKNETTTDEASRNQIQAQSQSASTKPRKKQRRQLVELTFLFGLIYDMSTPKPGKDECTLAANAIVPDIVKKSALQLKIRCDPKKGRTANVTKIEDDDWFDQENQVRYVVRGKIQVYVFSKNNNGSTDLTDDEVNEQMKKTAQSMQKLLKRHCSYRQISPAEAENAINQDSIVESADALRRWIREHNLF